MSFESDQRVVELQFNNKQFEANVSTTISTLDKLQNKLKFEGVTQGFQELEKASRNVSFDELASNIERLTANFTTLGGRIKSKIRDNIVSTLESTIKHTIKSMTMLEQLGTAWEKYGKRTSAVQTIMAATASQFADETKQLEVVEGQLDRLSWFTDETSYAFTDMVDNIGKFTSSGIKLDSAVNNMMGIATWAAVSGANAQVASGAMRELAQAIGSGVVMTKDWQSIETANMATAEFKQTVLDTAASLGQLRKTGDGVYKTAKGTLVTVKNFRNTLSEKWFTGQVLENALNRYGEFASKLGDAYNMIVDGGQAADFTTSKLIRLIEQHSQGNLDVAKTAAQYNVNASELQKTLDALASSEMELGLKSFKAAQEAKTFGEVIDSVKEAVASGWMESFNIVVGNYNEAKAMFTSLSEYLYDVFNGGAEARNQMLQAWKDNGGRDAILESFKNLAEAVESVTTPIKDAFRDIFPPMTGEKLAEFTRRFQNFTSHLKLSEEAAVGVHRVFSLIFSVAGKLTEKLKSLGRMAIFTVAVIKTLVDYLFQWIGRLEDGQPILSNFTTRVGLLNKALSLLGVIASAPIVAIGALGIQVSRFIQYCKNSKNIRMIYEAFSKLISVLKDQAWDKFSKIQAAFVKLVSVIRPYLPTIDDLTASIESFKSTISNIPRHIATAVTAFAEFLRSSNKFSKIADLFKNLGTNVISGLQLGIQNGFSFLMEAGSKMFDIIRLAFMNAAQIHSPSLVMKALGVLCATGVVLGIAGYYDEAREAGLNLFSAILEGANSAGIELPESFSRILELMSKGSKVLEQYLGPLDEFIARFFRNLTAGQVIMIAFAVTLGTFVKRLNRLVDVIHDQVAPIGASINKIFESMAKPFVELGKGLEKTFTSLSNGIDSFAKSLRKNANANNWLKIAAAMGIMAASIIALSWACRDENMTYIIRAGAIMGSFAVTLGGLMALATTLAKASGGSLAKISVNIVSVAFAIITLAGAMAMMSRLSTESPGKVIGVMLEFVLACAGLVGVIAAMNKYSKDGIKGSLALIAIANALRIVVNAISSAANTLEGTTNIESAVAVFGISVMAIAGLAKVMDGVKFGGGAGLFTTMLALRLAVEVLEAIIRKHKALVDSGAMINAKELWGDVAALAGLMLIAAAALRIAGDATLKAGLGVILACTALKTAINTLASITDAVDFANIQAWLATLMPLFRDVIMAMGLWTTVAAFFSTMNVTFGKLKFRTGNAKGLLRAFIGFASAMAILVGAIKLMEYLDMDKVTESTMILSELMIMFGIATAMAGLAKGAHQSIARMTNVIIALTGCLAFLSLFIQEGQELSMLAPALSLAGALVALGVALWGAGKITKEVKMAPIVAMLIGVLEIGVLMNGLAQYDWPHLISAGGGMALALAGFSSAIWIASKATDGIKFFNVVQMMLVLGEVAAAMYFLSTYEWSSLVAAAGSLSAAMLAISVAMRIASQASASLAGAGAFLIMAISLVPAAYAMSLLAKYDWGSILAACGGLVGSVSLLAFLGKVIGGAIAAGGWMPLLAFAGAIAILGAALLVFVKPAVDFANAVEKFGPAVDNMVDSLSRLETVDITAVAAAGEVIEKVGNALVSGATKIQPKISAAMSVVGAGLGAGLIEGVDKTIPGIYTAGELMGAAAESGIRDKTDTNSPSGLFKKIGGFFAQGLIEGVGDKLLSVFKSGAIMGASAVNGAMSSENLDAAETAGETLGQKIMTGLQNVWNKVKGWFGSVAGENVATSLTNFISSPMEAISGFTETVQNQYNTMLEDWFGDLGFDPKETDGVSDSLGNVADQITNLTDTVMGRSGAASAATDNITESLEELLDVFTYASSSVQYFYDKGDKLLKMYDNTTPWKNAIKSTEDLVLEHYKLINLYDDEIQAIQNFGDMNKKQAKAAKDAWVEYFDSVSNGISQGFGSVFTAPSFVNTQLDAEITTFDTMMTNLDAQTRQMTYFTNTLIKLKREGLNDVYLQSLLDAGPENLSEIISWDQLTAEEIRRINAQYEALQNATTNLTMDYITATAEQFELMPQTVANTISKGIASMTTSEIQNEVYQKTADILKTVLEADGDWEQFNGTRLGELLSEGIANGVEDTKDLAVSAVEQLAREMINELQKEVDDARAKQLRNMTSEWMGHITARNEDGTLVYVPTEAESSMISTLKDAVGYFNYASGSTNYDPDYAWRYQKWQSEGLDALQNAASVLGGLDSAVLSSNLAASNLAAQLRADSINADLIARGIADTSYKGTVSGSLGEGYQINLTQNNYSSDHLNAETIMDNTASLMAGLK